MNPADIGTLACALADRRGSFTLRFDAGEARIPGSLPWTFTFNADPGHNWPGATAREAMEAAAARLQGQDAPA